MEGVHLESTVDRSSGLSLRIGWLQGSY